MILEDLNLPSLGLASEAVQFNDYHGRSPGVRVRTVEWPYLMDQSVSPLSWSDYALLSFKILSCHSPPHGGRIQSSNLSLANDGPEWLPEVIGGYHGGFVAVLPKVR
uniref:Uncharacterized protein n=1 Tax=Micrurus corallinus TaxID=54390 RepID=A0A2D4EWB0_MICCO